MKRSLRACLSWFLLLPMVASAAGSVTTVNVSLDQSVEAPRWMFDSKAKVKGGPLIVQLVAAKKALVGRDRATCVSALNKSYKLGKGIGPWIAWNHLQCAILKDKAGKVSVESLAQAVAKVEAEPSWLVFGPAVPLLRPAYTAALLAMVEQQIKSDRRQAWATLDKLQRVRPWLTLDERASAYRWAGELAFIEQNLSAAQEFLTRSLSERENAEVRTKVESIRSTLLGRSKDTTTVATGSAPSAVPPANAKTAAAAAAAAAGKDLGISDEERDIFKRMGNAYDSQDFVSAIEDGVELIQKFPGSKRAAEASDRVLDMYVSLSNRNDEKFRHVRETVVKEMVKADSGRLSRWAANAYAKGNYLDGLTLAEKAYTKYDGHPDSTKVLLLAAKSAVAAGEYADARTHFEQLLKQHGGTAEAAEATFRLGLLEYRMKQYGSSAAYFERLLALPQAKDFEYRALYWQWRAQQKIDASKSGSFADNLIAKYPLSYYGLRARAELNGGSLTLAKEPLVVKAELRLLESERLAWERFNVLLKAGWFKEAERELDALPEPQSNEERLIRAKFWAAAMRYDNAIQLANKAIDENPDFMRLPLLKIVFPQEYAAYVTREGKASGVAGEWLLSIMRQESSFRPEVKSPSNAYGVMQLIPGTAQEIAREFRLKDYTSDSLLNPEINIKLGSVYVSRLAKNFNGNMPLALAAYNAGPSRLRRWLGARKELASLEATPSSAPEAEVWIDELPWDETSHYVKSILRNWLIYKILDGSKLSLSEPIWVDAKATTR